MQRYPGNDSLVEYSPPNVNRATKNAQVEGDGNVNYLDPSRYQRQALADLKSEGMNEQQKKQYIQEQLNDLIQDLGSISNQHLSHRKPNTNNNQRVVEKIGEEIYESMAALGGSKETAAKRQDSNHNTMSNTSYGTMALVETIQGDLDLKTKLEKVISILS